MGTEFLARIVQVTDAFDAMTSDRPYRTALSIPVALEELEKGRGSQFDPDIIDLFLNRKIYDVLSESE